MTGTRPWSGQLGTGSGNGLIEFGIPTDFKTKNTTIEAGYVAKAWNVKLQYLDSKFTNGEQSAQWTNFYMAEPARHSRCSRRTTTLRSGR